MKENKIKELLLSTDIDFYEKIISTLSLEEQSRFMKEFPEFLQMTEGGMGKEEQEEILKKILEKLN